MESTSVANPSSCIICTQPRFGHLSYPKRKFDDDFKYGLFHKPCTRCEDAPTSIQLCSHCRHLRLRHQLVCKPEDLFKDPSAWVSVALSPFSPEAATCEFCKLVASYMKKIPSANSSSGEEENESDVDINFCLQRLNFIAPSGPITFEVLQPDQSHNRLQPLVPWSWLRSRLTFISTRLEPAPSQLSFLPRKSLQTLRVIDVIASCVTSLPHGAQYAALSYVWGPYSAGQFQALQSNLQMLETQGSLERIELPLTIRDAIAVCRHLRKRYLWVDRLCIIQNAALEEKATQLEQMAAVYHHAYLTIVAVEGEDAHAGLAGVSRARKLSQQHLRFDEEFELVAETEGLGTILASSTWVKRAWTFQENMASSILLFFTDAGCFLQHGFGRSRATYAEGPVRPDVADMTTSSLDMITAYSKKTLTYPSDILRAMAGILNAVYRERTSLGMPWDDFDRSVLWSSVEERPLREGTEDDVFPSWSWISARGPVEFDRRVEEVYSFAYWARVSTKQEGIGHWLGIEATRKREGKETFSKTYEKGRLVAALAWLHGCLDGSVPEWLRLDCSRIDFEARVNDSWSDGTAAYWHDPFNFSEKNKLFDNLRANPLPGRLAVYTQKAAFTLDRVVLRKVSQTDKAEKHFFLLRTTEHRVAGSILLDEHSAQGLDLTLANFLLLSAYQPGGDPKIMQPFAQDRVDLDPAIFYGCPCALQAKSVITRDHIAECPQHTEFKEPIPFYPQRRTFDQVIQRDSTANTPRIYRIREIPQASSFIIGGDKRQALLKHLAEVSYLDVHGELLHAYKHPPALNVMLIIPKGTSSEGTTVYQRLGIGQVYLKRWVEAPPRFETTVLE